MLDTTTKKRIDECRDILVGKLPDPKAQIEQITIGLIYKFMDDMDKEAIDLGGTSKFFSGDFERYSWNSLFDTKVTAIEMLRLYSEAIESMDRNPNIPQLFRDIFKNAHLPYKDAETLKLFLRSISKFEYSHSEKLGDAFEYLLSILGSQGDAGQFRTPRHIIDMIVELVSPDYNDRIYDPACGTGGFLIASYKYILEVNSSESIKKKQSIKVGTLSERTLDNPINYSGDKLTPEQKRRLHGNIFGHDISPDMVRLSLVNMYLHGFANPNIVEFDTLTNDSNWGETYDAIFANPPFMTPKGGIKPHNRFSVASKKAELLFVDYIIEHLSPNSKAGIVIPEGIMFVNQNAFQTVRQKLINNGLFCVISLPHGVFKPYASVKTHVLLIDKRISELTTNILFVDIDSDGFTQSDTRVAIEENDIPDAKILISKYKDEILNSGSKVDFSRCNKAYLVDKNTILSNTTNHLIGRWYKLDKLFQNLENSRIGTDYLGNICHVERGSSPNMATEPGPYVMVVPAKERKSSDHYTFDCKGICIPLVSSSGHGKADIKRIHYQEGKFALANTMAVLTVKDETRVEPKYIYEVLKIYKDVLLTPLMSGATNVTMNPEDLEKVVFPLPDHATQKIVVERAAILKGLNKIEEAHFTFSKELSGKYKEINKMLKETINRLVKESSQLKGVDELYDSYLI